MKLHELMEDTHQKIPTRWFHETSYAYALKILQSGAIIPLWDAHPENKKAYLDQCTADGEEPLMAGGNQTFATTFTYGPHGHTYFGGQHNVNTLVMFLIDATKLTHYPNEMEFWPDLEGGLVIVNGSIPISCFAGVFIHQSETNDPAVNQVVNACKAKNLPVEVGDAAARDNAIRKFKG